MHLANGERVLTPAQRAADDARDMRDALSLLGVSLEGGEG